MEGGGAAAALFLWRVVGGSGSAAAHVGGLWSDDRIAAMDQHAGWGGGMGSSASSRSWQLLSQLL